MWWRSWCVVAHIGVLCGVCVVCFVTGLEHSLIYRPPVRVADSGRVCSHLQTMRRRDMSTDVKVILADGRIGYLVPTVLARHTVQRGTYAVRVDGAELHLARADFTIDGDPFDVPVDAAGAE